MGFFDSLRAAVESTDPDEREALYAQAEAEIPDEVERLRERNSQK
ncbi:hypothetical protein [Streptantibioticus silvisoli]|uniref:Uncharacterized protein n=1 Tax=Streptantibioticus silvisoli TaxID=2705255 RepID=A0ABT6W6Z8_9ACTN|nr:hypothetical protein [Streptantibioticus silvisoli]MDI5965747.1 hypothetical protein [Streptantibioticus silvisoli]